MEQDPGEAVRLAEKANRLTENKDPYILETLGMAFEASGRIEEAREALLQALDFARVAGDKRMMERIENRLKHISGQ